MAAGISEGLYYFITDKSDEVHNESRPVVLWLQGGPGASSLFGMFQEHGPFRISTTSSSCKQSNKSAPVLEDASATSWIKFAAVIYLDQPFGTGFSPPRSSAGAPPFVSNETDLGDAAAAAIRGVMAKHPEYSSRQFYVFGESFAGHMAPNVVSAIMRSNERAELMRARLVKAAQSQSNINEAISATTPTPKTANARTGLALTEASSDVGLTSVTAFATTSAIVSTTASTIHIKLAGLSIGDGWVDPVSQNQAFPEYAYSSGLISADLRNELTSLAEKCVAMIDASEYTKAF
jgi:carboxypeptidase C (cathepsin A)